MKRQARNRRRSDRIPVSVIVVVYQDNLAVIGGKTRDVGRGGSFIETGPITLPPGTEVELQATLEDHDLHGLFRTRAEVVHRCCEGMGLAFRRDIPEECIRRLRNLSVPQVAAEAG